MSVSSYHCGDVIVDAANRRLLRSGTEVPIEPKIFAVILQLLDRPGELVKRTELLDAVWGHRYVTPSTLNRLIALARRAFGDDSGEPRYIQTVHGAGYRYIGPLQQHAAAKADKPVSFAPPSNARLPARIESLIGREQEISAIATLLASSRMITLLGPGGIGKTQCALEASRRLTATFPDGVWFFDLAPMKSGEEWLRLVAAVLAIAPTSTEELLERIGLVLQGRRALVLLDNCDRVATQVGRFAFDILNRTDEPKILATSQSSLYSKGEQIMRVPPLALPREEDGRPLSLEEIAAAPAVSMLLTRVRAAQPAFTLNGGNAGVVAEICRRLDGVPLALELAAARFALLSPDQVLDRMQRRFHFLAGDVAGRDHRHRNLQVLLEWSFGLLSPEEQRLLTWLGVFVQGWTVDSAIAIAQAMNRDAETAVDLLSGLVNKSLVSVDATVTPPRYMLLESVREYALERLRELDQEQAAREAHLAYIELMCRDAHQGMLTGRMRQRIEQLIPEKGNINAALEFALGSESGRRAALSILGSLLLFVKAHGVYALERSWYRPVLAATEHLESVERGRALLSAGVVAMHVRQVAPTALAEAMRVAHGHRDFWTEAYANGYHALWLVDAGRAAEAMMHALTCERIAEQLDDPLLRGLAGLAHGWILLAQGDNVGALKALQVASSEGTDAHQRHFIQTYTALTHFMLGEYAAAANQWQQAMSNAADVANIRGIAGSVEGCAYLAARFGYLHESVRYLAVAQRIRERTGVPLFNFWKPHHDAAEARLRRELDAAELAALSKSVNGMRDEDVISDVAALLRQLSAE